MDLVALPKVLKFNEYGFVVMSEVLNIGKYNNF